VPLAPRSAFGTKKCLWHQEVPLLSEIAMTLGGASVTPYVSGIQSEAINQSINQSSTIIHHPSSIIIPLSCPSDQYCFEIL
jgi:hypothetical protein